MPEPADVSVTIIWPSMVNRTFPMAYGHAKHRQFENISASKSLRPHTCGRLGGSGAWWFLPRTHR
jgi:hypothetical protein